MLEGRTRINTWVEPILLETSRLPICRLKCLDRVLRTAARLVGRIPRFCRVSGYMRDVLHWPPTHSALSTASLRWFGVAWRVWHHPISGNSVAPLLLLSVVPHSAQAELQVTRTRTVIRQRRAFSVAGPTAWNGLPDALRLTPVAHFALFLFGLKTRPRLGWKRS